MIERADLRSHGPSGVLAPGIRTYKPRRTRVTERAERALRERRDLLIAVDGQPLDLAAHFGPGTPVVLDIGFGDGRATAALAEQDPGTGVLAVDVHTPGVGELLAALDVAGLTNVRVIEGDALGVLARMVPAASLAGVRSWFPDPWPKARHHKRRLVQPSVRDLIADRLVDGGWWHLATDWDAYAESMLEVMAGDARWSGGVIPRPEGRPVTRYEHRARLAGRSITDLWFTCRTTP